MAEPLEPMAFFHLVARRAALLPTWTPRSPLLGLPLSALQALLPNGGGAGRSGPQLKKRNIAYYKKYGAHFGPHRLDFALGNNVSPMQTAAKFLLSSELEGKGRKVRSSLPS
jgi:hypothetical protein